MTNVSTNTCPFNSEAFCSPLCALAVSIAFEGDIAYPRYWVCSFAALAEIQSDRKAKAQIVSLVEEGDDE